MAICSLVPLIVVKFCVGTGEERRGSRAAGVEVKVANRSTVDGLSSASSNCARARHVPGTFRIPRFSNSCKNTEKPPLPGTEFSRSDFVKFEKITDF